LAARSPDKSPHRADEPYRRAISGIYARLAATAKSLVDLEAMRHPLADAEPYRDAQEFAADLRGIHESLVANGAAPLAAGRLRHLRRALAVFEFIWRLSICARLPTFTSASWRSFFRSLTPRLSTCHWRKTRASSCC
jgi:phosphoenolpyruvate carboxylase